MTVADAVSVMGDQVGWIALLWFLMVTTHHSRYMGLLALAYGLPSVLLGAIVGNILDRMSHKKVLITANVILGFLFMAISVLYQIQALPILLMFLLVLMAGCLTPFTSVGWMVIVPTLVSENELGVANSIVETIWNGASLLGPLLGGYLISKFGATMAVFCDGISFWIAALCVFFVKETFKIKEAAASKDAPLRLFLKEASEGFKMLFRLKVVWWITLGAVVINLAYGGLEVSLPLLTHNQLAKNAFFLGTLWTTYFISSLIGSIISGFIFRGNKSGILMGIMTFGWGISFIPMIWWPSLWITYTSMIFSGLLFGGFPPLARTTVQRLVPKEFQGRIFGLRGSMIAIGPPMGSYLSGMLGQWMLPSSIIGLMGTVIMCVGLFLISLRHFREI